MSLTESPADRSLPLLPMRGGVVFPGTTQRVPIGRRKSLRMLDALPQEGARILVGLQRDPTVKAPAPYDLLPIATLARVVRVDRGQRGVKIVTLEGIERARIEHVTTIEPFWRAIGGPIPDDDTAQEATMLADALLDALTERLGDDHAKVPPRELSPGAVADAVAAMIPLTPAEAAELLTTTDAVARLRTVTQLAGERIETNDLKAKIDAEVRSAMGKQQREAILRRQLVAIQKELGEDGDDEDDIAKLERRLLEADLPDEVRKVADRELKRLRGMQAGQMEYNVTRNYLEWIADLPWRVSVSTDPDLNAVAEQLDADHYGLDDVKKRIVEHMAVLKLTGGHASTILCLAGPPGVGKTSLGESVARATGRPFVRIALGGVRDEAEVRGHRRTYVGALPGRLITALKKAGANNPVVLLDEIDKLAGGGWSGSPESALLEVLDPEQNHTFTDHYLELQFDLSNVLFICTANDLGRLSAPLRDRMEIVELAGYTPEEKEHIAKNHLLPQQLDKHGLDADALTLTDDALRRVISDYTREPGVRQLKRELTRLCRAVAVAVAKDGSPSLHVEEGDLKTHLGKKRHKPELAESELPPGVATGLAWTPVGGDILYIETTRMPGKGGVTVTGQLGDVMKESARAALSFVRSRAGQLGVDPRFLAEQDVHIHVPAGAVPKDGPSAGVTMFTALTSLLTGRRVRTDTAMTGECTLRGRVLPVGGIKSKVLAAHRAGLRRVILPRGCEPDLDDVPESVREVLTFLLVDDMNDVLSHALVDPGTLEATVTAAA